MALKANLDRYPALAGILATKTIAAEGGPLDSLQKAFPEHAEEVAESFMEDGDTGTFEADGTEYRYYVDEDAAIRAAELDAREGLSEGLFNPDFVRNYLYMTDTDRRVFAGDEVDSRRTDIQDDILKERWDDVAQMLDTEVPEGLSEAEMTKHFETALEEWASKEVDRIENELKDPIQYFVKDHGIFTVEELMKQPWISIDLNEAASDAVTTDGWAHFLSRYDGDYKSTPEGVVYFRES